MRRDSVLATALSLCQHLAATPSTVFGTCTEKRGPSCSSSFALGLFYPHILSAAKTDSTTTIPQFCSSSIPWHLQWDVMADGSDRGPRKSQQITQHLGAVPSRQPPALPSLSRLRSWSCQGL